MTRLGGPSPAQKLFWITALSESTGIERPHPTHRSRDLVRTQTLANNSPQHTRSGMSVLCYWYPLMNYHIQRIKTAMHNALYSYAISLCCFSKIWRMSSYHPALPLIVFSFPIEKFFSFTVLRDCSLKNDWWYPYCGSSMDETFCHSSTYFDQILFCVQVINKQHPAGAYVLNKNFPKHQTATGPTGIMGSTEPTSPSQEPSVVKKIHECLHTSIQREHIWYMQYGSIFQLN